MPDPQSAIGPTTLSPADERALRKISEGLAELKSGVGRAPLQLVEVICRFEQQRRQLATVDHALIAEIEAVGVATDLCAPDTVALLVQLLHISPGEAKARVTAAADLGPRFLPTGETLAPLFGPVAAAQAASQISAEHASVIRRTIDDLPDAVEAEHGAQLMHDLVDQATTLNPVDLAKIATRSADALDPDAAAAVEADHERRRTLNLAQRRDGMFVLTGLLTADCGALLRTMFDSLAAPVPAADGARDPRSPGQRMHDALRDIPPMALRSGQLADCGGIVATLLVTLTADELESGSGYATTGHGDLIPVRKVIELATDSQLMSVLLDPNGGVMSYGQNRRLAPPGLRLALYARDRGCSFPGCDRPPAWTQAHHFDEFVADHGPTSVANMGLVCGVHHREFARRGWTGVMIDGVPHWIAPVSLDPTQTPRRNTRHHATLRATPSARKAGSTSETIR